MSDLSSFLAAAANAAQGGDPEVTSSIALASSDPLSAAVAAGAAQNYAQTAQTANNLAAQPTSVQSTVYGNANSDQQNQLQAGGYKPPSHAGFWGFVNGVGHDIHNDVFKPIARNPVFRDTAGAVLKSGPVSDIAAVAGAGLRLKNHVIRTAMDLMDQADPNGGMLQHMAGLAVNPVEGLLPGQSAKGDLGAIGHLFSPSELSRAWNETNNGSKFILPRVVNQVKSQYGDDTYQLAYKMAAGADVNQLLAGVDPSQVPALQAQLASPDVQAAIADLKAGQLSLGHWLVGSNFIIHHPAEGNDISGGIDGLFDFFGDPTILGGKVAKGAELARYLVRSADDVNRIAEAGRLANVPVIGQMTASANVNRAFADMADKVRLNQARALQERYNLNDPMVRGLMATDGTAEGVQDFFAGRAGVAAAFSGLPVRVNGEAGAMLPHLSYLGQGRLAVKGALTKAINWGDDRPLIINGLEPGDVLANPSLVNPNPTTLSTSVGLADKTTAALTAPARAVTANLRMIVKKAPFQQLDPNAASSANEVHNLASIFLPKTAADDIYTKWVLTKNVAEKRQVWVSLLRTLKQATGWSQLDDMAKAFEDRFTSDISGENPERNYGANGSDGFDVNGMPVAQPIFEGQVNQHWGLPPIKEMIKRGQQLQATRMTIGAINRPFMDKYMNFWRGYTIGRLGFAFRASGEEALRNIAANGFQGWFQGRMAASALARSDDPNLTMARTINGEVPDTWDRWMGHLPNKIQSRIKTPEDFITRAMADKVNRAMASVQSKLAGPEYMEGTREMVRRGLFDPDGEFGKTLSAQDRPYDDSITSPKRIKMFRTMDGQLRPVQMAYSGAYKLVKNTEDHFEYAWNKGLQEAVVNSKWGRMSLENRELADQARENLVADQIQKYPAFWAQFMRSLGTRDGNLIADGTVTERDAAIDHARAVNQAVDAITRHSITGDDIPLTYAGADGAMKDGTVADYVLEHDRAPRPHELATIDEADRPLEVKGPELIPLPPAGGLNRLSNWIFTHHVGPTMNWISRQPITIDTYVKARRTLRMPGGMRDQWLKDATDEAIAEQRAQAGGAWYHGSTDVHPTIKPVDYKEPTRNLYGPGFYTTADPSVASAYAGGSYHPLPDSSPGIFRTEFQHGIPKFVDLDQVVLPDDVADMMGQLLHDHFPREEFTPEQHTDHLGDPIEEDVGPRPPANAGEELSNFMDAVDEYATREARAHLREGGSPGQKVRSVAETLEEQVWQQLHQNLDALGYHGWTHTGGRLVGDHDHQVAIWFNPQRDLGLPQAQLKATHLAQLQSNIDKVVHDTAWERTLNEVSPYIHNPDVKSQFSTITRNISPFWFAKEQFFKRWARTAYYSPWAFRKAQLIDNGLQHVGFIQTNPNDGSQYFVYPGVNVGQQVLTHFANAVHIPATLPLAASLTGNVAQLNPGIERPFAPDFSPFVVFGLNSLRNFDPYWSKAIDSLTGPAAASQNVMADFLPLTLQHAEAAAELAASSGGGVFTAAQQASATAQAVQALEASGHGITEPASNFVGSFSGDGTTVLAGQQGNPGDYATDDQGDNWVMQRDGVWRRNDAVAMQKEMDRVRNWSRVLLMMRAVFGYSTPASPELQFNPSNMHEDLLAKMKTMPFDEAMNAFMADHPDGTAYTVFQTTSQGNVVPPATTGAMDYIDSHRDLFDSEAGKMAGVYFIPTPDTAGPYSQAAYQEQLKEGFRIKKAPDTFANDISYQIGANEYFANYDQMKQDLLQPPAGMDANSVKAQWTAWSQAFQAANPIFANELATKNGPSTRADIMAAVGKLLDDPRVPDNPTSQAIGELYSNWRQWQTDIGKGASGTAPHLTTAVKTIYNQQFATWAENFAATHPDVQGLYNRAIRPDLVSILNTIAPPSTSVLSAPPTPPNLVASLNGSNSTSA